MSCSPHACDCQRPPAAVPDEMTVELWAIGSHVSSRLRTLLGSERVSLSGPLWAEQLATAMEQLTPTERSALRVGLADGDVLRAATALERGRTPWLPGLIAERSFFMVYQPVVDLRTGATHGREALVRGRVGDRELNGGEIISAASAHDALFQTDVAARTRAIEDAAVSLPDDETLFVNFNPTAIYEPDVCLRTTWAAARRVSLPLSRVCFEVVETERYPDLDFLERILTRYREEGALVALDDLGSGHASVSYLRRLRPDIVKLDRSLATSLQEDRARRRLVAALIDYAHELGIVVVAEGLESAADVEAARAVGADLGQGWHLGRPVRTMEKVDPALVTGTPAAPRAHRSPPPASRRARGALT